MRSTTLNSGWEFIQTDLEGGKVGYCHTEWLPANVPGHVHLDLMDNGVIPDPFERMLEMGVQWVDEKDWSYRTTFDWSPTADLPRRVLRFEGLDTVCTVLLNGEKIAEHDNMFVPLEVDVTNLLVEGSNTLRIDFQSAIKVGNARRDAYFAAEGVSDQVQRFEERSFVRKAQYMFGWDWGPRLVSCGIWRPVQLLEFAARLKDVQVYRTPDGDGGWDLQIVSEVEGDGVALHTLVDFEGDPFLVPDGTTTIEGVEEWTPEDPDASRLELVTVVVSPVVAERIQAALDAADTAAGEEFPNWELPRTLLDFDPAGDGPAEMIQAVLGEAVDLLDQRLTRCDVGTVKLLRQADEYGESFEFEVNGRRIWARGANWIPDDNFPSRITRAQLRDRIEKAKDMGFNMLRIWGGGLYETDEFYELCDELGMLVWQDFPFACAYYPDGPEAQAVIAHEAAVNIRRIRNHPSLALWCGNNENHEMFFNQWGGPEAQPARYYGINLYDQTLPQALLEHDPSRSYIPSSPIGTPAEETVKDEKRRGPNADGYGDQHNWDVWHGRGDWKYYTDSKGRFSSEYGFASACGLPAWKKIGLEPSAPFPSPLVRWHDKTLKGFDTFVGYVELHYPVSQTIEDWTYYSQLNQRDALRHGVEHYRRSPFCRGSLIWQFNDCWPVQSWAMMDSLGHYKALGYEARRLHADAGIQIVRDLETVQLFAFNDSEIELAGPVTLRAYHLTTGELLKEWTADAELAADDRRAVFEASVAGLPVPDTLLVANWVGDFTWRLLAEPKTARLAPAGEILYSLAGDGYVEIRTSGPVVDLWLTFEGSVEPFAENFLTIPTPATVRVELNGPITSLEARSLSGRHPVRSTRSPL